MRNNGTSWKLSLSLEGFTVILVFLSFFFSFCNSCFSNHGHRPWNILNTGNTRQFIKLLFELLGWFFIYMGMCWTIKYTLFLTVEMLQHIWKPLFSCHSKLSNNSWRGHIRTPTYSVLPTHSGNSSRSGCNPSVTGSYFVALSF